MSQNGLLRQQNDGSTLDTRVKNVTSVTHSNQSAPDVTLRLVWPQWQGGGTPSVRQYAAEFPFDVGRRWYAVGSAVLAAVLPPHDGPTVTVPVTMTDEGLAGTRRRGGQGDRS